jgi:anti-sigma B factor antagonist
MVVEQSGGICILKLPQHFAGAAVKDAMVMVRKSLESNVTEFIFDFEITDLVDSSGIGTLVSIAKDLRGKGGSLSLRNLKPDLFQLFKDTGLDKIFTIEDDGAIKKAEIDLFENAIDIRLDIKKEEHGEICIFHLIGLMNYPIGSRYFKQQFLLALAIFKKVLLDVEELTFFDSLSVSTMLNMNKLVKETGGSMRVCGANYIVSDLFSTLNIDAIIPVFNTQEEALADWK